MANAELRVGVLSGLCFSLFGQLPIGDLLETALLAAIGAIVSFIISRILQWLFKPKR